MTKVTCTLFALLLFFVACEKQSADVKKGGSVNPNAPSYWLNSKFPLRVKIADQFDGNEVTAITAGAVQWETSTNQKLNFFTIETDRPLEITNSAFSSRALYDSEMVVYKTTNWPWDGGVLAITQLWGTRYNQGTSSEYVDLVHADILVNYRNGINTDGSGYDLQTIMLHEFGHFLGLYHSADGIPKAASVMYPSIGILDVDRHVPFQYDINALADLYGIVVNPQPLTASATVVRGAEERFQPFDDGVDVIIQLELRKDGECIHRENGEIIQRHHSPHFNN